MVVASSSDWDAVQTSESRRRPTVAVRDDWEDDDEEQEAPNGEVNKKIWEEADSKASEPMPVLIASSSSRSIAAPPPAAAFQPVLKILKRPQSNPSSPLPAAVSASTSTESFQEREARYQAARNRIFGESSSISSESASSSTTSLPLASSISRDDRSKASAKLAPATSVMRNPRGPETVKSKDGSGSISSGFEGKRNKSPQLSQTTASKTEV